MWKLCWLMNHISRRKTHCTGSRLPVSLVGVFEYRILWSVRAASSCSPFRPSNRKLSRYSFISESGGYRCTRSFWWSKASWLQSKDSRETRRRKRGWTLQHTSLAIRWRCRMEVVRPSRPTSTVNSILTRTRNGATTPGYSHSSAKFPQRNGWYSFVVECFIRFCEARNQGIFCWLQRQTGHSYPSFHLS